MNAPRTLSARAVQKFRRTVYGYYKTHKRMLPWRDIDDPYRVLVSEIMLQQTQASRVLVYYDVFVRRFPTIAALSRAPLRDVLTAWQGLGYNRRALSLKKIADIVMMRHAGKIPLTLEALEGLPGIGKATAAEVYVFSLDKPAVFIETNIRSVFIRSFFPARTRVVHDKTLAPLVSQTLDRRNPRQWYYALMDYGVFLKKHYPNPSRKSAHYRRQSRFEGSRRQLRGRILTLLLGDGTHTESSLCVRLRVARHTVREVLAQLAREGLIKRQRTYSKVV